MEHQRIIWNKFVSNSLLVDYSIHKILGKNVLVGPLCLGLVSNDPSFNVTSREPDEEENTCHCAGEEYVWSVPVYCEICRIEHSCPIHLNAIIITKKNS